MIVHVETAGPFMQNGFVVACEKTKEAVLIDPGDGVQALLAYAQRKSLAIRHILLTHAHIGHYAGLMYLGREALGADHVPILCTPRMAAFLRENEPWKQLARLGQIEIREVLVGHEVAIGHFQVTPITVPHRDEFSDTVGYRVRGPSRSLLYIPDIDKWERWDRKVADEVAGVDVALVDGTFEDAAEVPGRSLAEIPHPLVGETMALLSPPALRGRVHFIHLNHTNRLLWDPAAVQAIEARGFRLARDGEAFPL